MKRSISILLAALAIAGFAPLACAQGTLAPLFLYTNGPGGISPFSSGQLLQVGQTYDLQAVPDAVFLFSSWEPVNIFTTTRTIIGANGTSNGTQVSIVASPVPDYTSQPGLEFIMQPEMVLFSSHSEVIAQDSGWQANFVPIPEPSSVTLILCGLLGLFYRRKLRERRI